MKKAERNDFSENKEDINMAYNAKSTMQAEDKYEDIGYDINDELSDEYEDDEDYDDYDEYGADDLQWYFEVIEDYVDRLKEVTLSSLKKRDRLGKVLAVSVGMNIITAAAAVALCCCGSSLKLRVFSAGKV